MPRKLPQHLKLYGFDETDNTVIEHIQLDEITNLQHTTRIPGGYWTLKFTKALTIGEYWEWRLNRRWYRCILEQASKQVLFEGRLELMEGPIHAHNLTFRGYWSNFTDSVSDAASYTRTYSAQRADQIVSDMLSNGFDADAIQVSTSTANLANTGTSLTLDFEVFDKAHLNLWQILTDPNFGVLSFPDSNDNKVDLAVWEDREVYLTARNPSAVSWRAYISGKDIGVQRLPVRVNYREIAKSVAAVYQDSARTNFEDYTVTSFADDSLFSNTHDPKREYVIPAIKDSPQATAEARRDGELDSRKEAQQQVDDFIITKVFDANGLEQPVCNIRAGDVLQIPDLVPNSTSLSGADLDALRTFVIEETTCDHGNGQVRIRPDRSSKSLGAILARARLT